MSLPEQAFYMVGKIDEVVEKAKRIERRNPLRVNCECRLVQISHP